MKTLRSASFSVLLGALALPCAAHEGIAEDGEAGVQALDSGSYDEAIRLFTRVLKAEGVNADDRELAYLDRGKAYLGKGDTTDALADLRHALRLKPDDADAQNELKLALSPPGGNANAPSPTNESAAQAEDDATTAMSALNRGDYAQAVMLLSRAINSGTLGSDDMELAYLSRGKAYSLRGDSTRAIADLSKALQLNANDQEAQAAFGQALIGMHANTSVTPVDTATCSSTFSSTGSWLHGNIYHASATYQTLSTIEAFAGAYAYLSSPASALLPPTTKGFVISRFNLDQGTISASEPIPNGTGSEDDIEVKIEPVGTGSKTSVILTEAPGIFGTGKGWVCNFLREVAKG